MSPRTIATVGEGDEAAGCCLRDLRVRYIILSLYKRDRVGQAVGSDVWVGAKNFFLLTAVPRDSSNGQQDNSQKRKQWAGITPLCPKREMKQGRMYTDNSSGLQRLLSRGRPSCSLLSATGGCTIAQTIADNGIWLQ